MTKGVAWYDVKGQGWLRDIFVLLHPPYTLWHLSYIPIGAALAPVMNWALLGWTYLAFFLGMGIGGHFLDELNGRPLKTQIPGAVLWVVAGLSIAGAMVIGVLIGVKTTVWIIPCILFGAFIVFAYNLELGLPGQGPKPRFFHMDFWFGVAWGAFPAITAYVVQTGNMSWDSGFIGLFALLFSMAQRKLSLQSRYWRRRVTHLEGHFLISLPKGGSTWGQVSQRIIIGPVDLALKYLNGAVVAIALGLLLIRV
jgi:hypothetical protein